LFLRSFLLQNEEKSLKWRKNGRKVLSFNKLAVILQSLE
jgi:hypothetical protein